ncbi:phosphatidate cytidylyltransferase [Falsirhodobacter algicola]|uniref:Phosphatidate cytidylyltransferase n=1 Tax=Falsirhodobacter algicola TaxID=2692330 RepID=A0A8J8MRL6_9RHOB|nr:phosphatidate cytidylyltransferase [Falsirhodobacter algicola]QUS35450.1 phosphatidate cytidylyltransferase [Falsirhodobacter algicola]
MKPAKKHGRWGDLPKRMLSAAIMLLVGVVEVWMGGVTFAWLVILLTGLMTWELARMQNPRATWVPIGLGLLAAVTLLAILQTPVAVRVVLLFVPSVAAALLSRHHKVAAVYTFAILISGYTLIDLRSEAGTAVIVWLIALVVVSDVMGYFVGRSLGGPKFWPRVSPNKTWSGTIGGWVGAAVIGAIFVVAQNEPWQLILLSPVVAFAGQLGDIAESWIKRRAGIKDSSSLIPGHGGVLDRFDALIGAVVAIMLLSLLFPLPIPDSL